MTKEHSRHVQFWRHVADDLGLEVVAPFDLPLATGTMLRAPLLLPNFGAERGMIVLPDYGSIKDVAQQILDAGYGYSVLSEPGPEEDYVREDYMDVLCDWGWSGEPSKMPAWLRDRLGVC